MDTYHRRDWAWEYARRVRLRAVLAAGFGSDKDTSASESSGEDVIVVHGSEERSEGVSLSANAAPPPDNIRNRSGRSDGENRGLRSPKGPRTTTGRVNFNEARIETHSDSRTHESQDVATSSDTGTHVLHGVVSANTCRLASLSDLKPAPPVRDLTTEEQKIVNRRKNYIAGDQLVLHGQSQSFLRVNAWAGDVIINSFSVRINERNRRSVASDSSHPTVYVFNSFLAERLLPVKNSHMVRRNTTHKKVKNWFGKKNGPTVFIAYMDVLVFPLNEKRHHWTLLFVDARTQSLVFYERLKNVMEIKELEKCKRLRQYVLEEDKNRRRQGPSPAVCIYDGIEEWPLAVNKTFPKQMDGDSCGLFIMLVAYYV